MQRTTKSVLCILSLVIAIGLWLKATVIQVPSGTWAPAGNMAEARAGAASVLLQDGTILVTGGEGASGPLASAEFFNAGSFAAAPAMNVARNRHAAVVLQDGRVLVTGGKTTGGSVTNAAEVYSAALDSWTVIGSMADARSGHTATLLEDGRVLLAGGEGSAGAVSTLEVFDPFAGTFAFAGTMSSARKSHAAALLYAQSRVGNGRADDRVLIAGGSDGANVLASTEIYDAETGAVTAGPALSTPRVGLSATTLMDGNVLVAGGSNSNNGTADLASAEVFNSATGVISPLASLLATGRRDHSAFLLPNNNHVLIVGGTSGGTALATAELFRPWDGNFYPTGSMSAGRPGSSGTALGLDGLLLVAGGNGLASSELYGFATLKTDRDDYAPGELVTMTGSGWQPGETVTLFLHEINNPDPHDDLTLTAVANASGRIVNNQFAPDEHDLGIRFYLTASGLTSNLQAQTTFTDSVTSVTITSPTNAIPITVTSLPANVTISFSYVTSSGATTGVAEVLGTLTVPVTKVLVAGSESDSIVVTIPTGTVNGSYNAKVTVNNNTGTGANQRNDVENNAIIVNIPSNTPPTAEANGPYSVNEGGSVVLSGSGSDPDAGQTLTYTWDLDNNGTFETAGQNPTFSAMGRDGASSQTVVLKVCDSGSPSLCHTDTSTVNILNAPPVANAGADKSGIEGSPINFTFSCTDAGTTDTWTASVNWGDGSPAENLGAVTCNSGTFPAMHTYADDDGSPFTVTLTVTDDDGGSHSDTAAATVANAPPVANAGADKSGTEGSPINFTFSCTDAGTADTWTGSVNWGDGSPAENLGAVTCNLGTFSTVHTYADNVGSPFTVTLTVTDDDSGSHSDTATATVANVLPVLAPLGLSAAVVVENDTVTLSGLFTDPGVLDYHAVVITWGDTGTTTINLPAGTLSFSASHQYLDDNPTATAADNYSISVTVTDKDGGSGSGGTSITVNNALPVVGNINASPSLLAVNNQTTVTTTLTDVGTLDTHTCTIDWDDGSTTPGTVASGTCSGTKIYAATGVYAVRVEIQDDDTGKATTKYEYVVVYDPSAGFVTGGGWIQSPAGAYRADLSAMGKANFGFVSKYLKGSSIPTGETEFQLHFANFNFHSSSYQWLVVSGPKAQYKGSGKVNGAGNYGFLLTATDGQISGGGGTDRFRIKIWDISNGDTVVYDNVLGASEDIDAANPQIINGGSITIHAPKK